LANLPAYRGWEFPKEIRLPNMGTPGISGRPLILGMSVRLKNLIAKNRIAAAAKRTVWRAIVIDEENLLVQYRFEREA
jgi:hypothetical protein